MVRKAALLATLTILVPARPARAFPVFARKYGMSCSSCHVGWPTFNQEGVAFRDNGFQFDTGKDELDQEPSSFWPISLRTTPAYQLTSATNQPSDAGPVESRSGGVSIGAVDLLAGGTLAKDVSFLVVLTGFADGTASIESGWVRFDRIAKTGWLNFKIGKFELDLPASAHRNVTLTTPYAAYGAHPAGSTVAFDMSQNQWGFELDGHNDRSMTRYAIAVVSANDAPSSHGYWSAPLVYGHLQQASETGLAGVPWVRGGVFGAVGWWPTRSGSCTADVCDGVASTAIPGTGRDHGRYERAGVDVSFMLGYPSTPFVVTAAYIYGHEGAGFFDPAEQVTSTGAGGGGRGFNGAFVEADWVPVSDVSDDPTPLMLFARYDGVRYETGPGKLDGVTVGLRHYLSLGPRASVAMHLEGHWDRVRGAGYRDPASGVARDVDTRTLLAGVDFSF
jgi:hypothetical protein